MRVGDTYTRDFDLETRQHEILGLDLGEGPSRRTVVVGMITFIVWFGGLLLIFGLPNKFTFSLYFLPPLFVTVFGAQRSQHNPRRWRLTHWALAVRYLVIGHRPVINGGRRAAARSEWLLLRERFGQRAEHLATIPGLAFLGRDDDARPGYQVAAGAPVRLNSKVRLYGPDRVGRAHKIKNGVRR